MAVTSTHAPWVGVRQRPPRDLVAAAPVDAWARLSCGDGSTGPRLYDWLCLPITHAFGAYSHLRHHHRRDVEDGFDVRGEGAIPDRIRHALQVA